MNTDSLPLGPIGEHAVHVAIDMQVYFARNSEWASPATQSIAANVACIAEHAPGRTIFTRFMTPQAASQSHGQWKHYYRYWTSVLADRNDPAIYDLLPELLPFSPPALVVDKTTHSAFKNPEFDKILKQMGADTLIFTGVETDVCVLGTALSAVDQGYRVLLVSDALASSDANAHSATLEVLAPRYNCQIDILDTASVLRQWTDTAVSQS